MAFHSAVTPSTAFVERLPPSLDCKHLEGRDYDFFFIIIHRALADQSEGNRKKRTGVVIFSHSQSRNLELCRKKSGGELCFYGHHNLDYLFSMILENVVQNSSMANIG